MLVKGFQDKTIHLMRGVLLVKTSGLLKKFNCISMVLFLLVMGIGMGGCVFFDIFNGIEDDDKEDAPYLIKNIQDLQNMEKDLSASYALANDIDASDTEDWNEGEGFDPIGDYDNPFVGSFDGQGYKITGLHINIPDWESGSGVGLFGYIDEGAKIKNVGLVDVDIVGFNNVGALVGLMRGGDVSGVNVTGSVQGLPTWGAARTGGLAGRVEAGKVTDSYSTAEITGDSGTVGGLIGLNSGGEVTNCYATGNVTAVGAYIGGLIGQNHRVGHGELAIVRDSHAEGDVRGGSRVGGLIGRAYGGEIHNSYATGSVKADYHAAGGFIGVLNCVAYNSYATGNVEGERIVGGFAGHLGGTGGEIHECFATGNVTGEEENVGGLVGSSTSIISNSYASGSVTGAEAIGGLLGRNEYQELTTGDDFWGVIENSYSKGVVTGDSNAGGLLGIKEDGSEVIASYWDIGLSGKNNSPSGEGRTTEQMQAGTPNAWLDENGNEDLQGDIIYVDWEKSIWEFGSSTEHPFLQWEK